MTQLVYSCRTKYSVSSAVVQRYLDAILQAALSPQLHIQAAAIDILSFVVRQGLAHPLQVRSLQNIMMVALSVCFTVVPNNCCPGNQFKL
jgi:hypothetical protein